MTVLGQTDLGNGISMLTIDHDPLAVATDAPLGSFFINTIDKRYWKKLDDGLTTNVALFAEGAGAGTAVVVIKKKGVNEDIVNSTVFQDDDDLFLDVLDGEFWAFRGILLLEADSVQPDFQFRFTGVGDLNLIWERIGSTQAGLIQGVNISSGKVDLSNTETRVITFDGAFQATADGELRLQWTQFAANANFTRIAAGSWFVPIKEAGT